MTGRAALGALGALIMVAAVALQLYRFTLDPAPAWLGPVLWPLTWGCLSGGALLIAWSLVRRQGEGRADVGEQC